MLQKCNKDYAIIGGRSTPFDISDCAIDLIDGAQYKCKCKCWFLFYAFLWTCRETEYFRISCELVGWLTISKYQALEIVYCAHDGAVEGVVGERKSVSWGGARTKGDVHKHKITKNMFFHSDLMTSLSYSLTQLYFNIRKIVLQGNGVILIAFFWSTRRTTIQKWR